MSETYVMPALAWPPGTKWVRLPSGRQVAEMEVSPALAESMLALNTDNQRRPKPATVSRYAADMSGGKWRLTHQGLAFNRNGKLHDGQNRLRAVVKSGVTVTFTVWVGAGGDVEMTVFDTNAPRSIIDAANVVRLDVTSNDVSPLWAAIRYGMVNGQQRLYSLTHSSRLVLLEQYKEEMSRIRNWFGASRVARSLGTSPVRAAVLCAQSHVDHDTLEMFTRIFTEQLDTGPGDRAAKMLRGFLTANPNAPERERFLKACRAILLFANREEPKTLVACTENPFPFFV